MPKPSYRLMLVGAANRVELVKLIAETASAMQVDLKISSVESSSRVPIASSADVIVTDLEFDSVEFPNFLAQIAQEDQAVVVPLMDKAVGSVESLGNQITTPITTDAKRVLDKRFLKSLCLENDIPVPRDVKSGPAHARPIFGNAGRGTAIVHLDNDSKIEPTGFLYEEILIGDEVSVDAYIFKDGTFSAIARDRIRVVGGEVQHTRTRELTVSERVALEKLLAVLSLRGPINVQFMGKDCKLLEINPRFGGGSTASVRAGWKGPKWLISEYFLEHKITDSSDAFSHVEVMRAWKDYVWRENGSNWN